LTFKQKLHRFCGRRCGGHRVNECAGWVLYCMCTDHMHSLHYTLSRMLSRKHTVTPPSHTCTVSRTQHARSHSHSHARTLTLTRGCFMAVSPRTDRLLLLTGGHWRPRRVRGRTVTSQPSAWLASDRWVTVLRSSLRRRGTRWWCLRRRQSALKRSRQHTVPHPLAHSHAMDTHKQSK